MKVHIEYGNQKLNFDTTDTQFNLRLAINMAWNMFGDKDSKIIFMPTIPKQDEKKTLSKLKKAWGVK